MMNLSIFLIFKKLTMSFIKAMILVIKLYVLPRFGI